MATENEQREVQWLLQELEDPFVIIPLQGVARLLSGLLSDSDEEFADRQGPYGVARKYWDVQSENLHSESGLLLGAAFVLGQTALTQTVSIVNRLRVLADSLPSIPASRSELIELDVPIDPNSSLGVLLIIDTAANYFKHDHEWPSDWTDSGARAVRPTSLQSRTITNALRLGMEPKAEVTDNLQRAFGRVCTESSDVSDMATLIRDWRQRLARRLYKSIGLQDPEED